jgi:hypothetical protein
MKRFLKYFIKFAFISTSSIIQLIVLIISSVIILGLAYIVGYRYLLGVTLMGNDAFSYFTVVHWMSQYFPHIPFWFSQGGGGVSFTGYPWLAAYTVVLLSRVTSLDLVQAYRLIGFLTVPLTGIGIFCFAWFRLTDVKPTLMRQVLGLIAGLMYVISPIAWIWLAKWGFYSEHTSHVFFPWTLIFFDLFICRLFAKKYDFLYRLGLAGTIIFWVITFNYHFLGGVSLIMVFLFLGLVHFIFIRENRFVLVKRLIKPILIFGILFSCLFAFRIYPYDTYNKAVAIGGFTGYGGGDERQGRENNTLSLKMLLSLEDPKFAITDPRAQIIDMRYAFYVWVLAAVALLFSVFKSKTVFALALYSFIGFLINTSVDLQIYLNKIPIVNNALGWLTGRGFFIPARLTLTIAAAYGAYIIWELIWTLLLYPLKKLKVMLIYYSFIPLKTITILLLTLLTVWFAIQKDQLRSGFPYLINVGSAFGKLDLRDIWHKRPPDDVNSVDEKNRYIVKHPEAISMELIADYLAIENKCINSNNKGITYPIDHICSYYLRRQAIGKLSIYPPLDLLAKAKTDCNSKSEKLHSGLYEYCNDFYKPLVEQLQPRNWSKFQISSDISAEVKGTDAIFSSFPKSEEYRYDISGFSGRQIMIAPMINKNSQIQIYINSLSLIYNAWNYQAQVMYTIFPLYQKPGTLTQLGKWFGLNYVFLAGSGLEPFSYWKTDPNWQVKDGNINGAGWRYFNNPTGLITWDTRPKMLVISDNSKYFYDQTFRFFTWGGLNYDQAIPVMGKKEIDNYSYDELKQYDMVFMRGYGYKWTWNAHRLLDKYVKNGGKLIFDTGWQFYDPDFQIINAPLFMPFTSLEWKNLDSNKHFVITDNFIAHDLDVLKFGDLAWEDTSWGVSVPTTLRDWAKPVVSFDGRPLVVVGQYGKGKVVWSGFNIIPHAEGKDSLEEVKLFNRLVEYLLSGQAKTEQFSVFKKENNPDKLTFTLLASVDKPTSFYYREAYYPDWHAVLIRLNGSRENIKINRAGPGFMLLNLLKIAKGDTISLYIQKSITQQFMEILSLLTFIGLIIYLVLPKIIHLISGFLINIFVKVVMYKRVLSVTHKHLKKRLTKSSANRHNSEEENY